MVNFEGTPDMIGKFVDVEITDVYPNSLRGKVCVLKMKWVCAWQNTGISDCPYPQRKRPWRGLLSAVILRPARSGGLVFSLFIPIFIAMLAPFSCGVNNFLIGR
ncbi:tRNA-i(6)A37 thiotransferase enzyme MiaB [Escherichia coli]|uniref:tRNA-i(6)A37 thiotransferase enzyme MiaB n=1 Tax=Escherichia coli TaxID=562 RepID=A0A377B0L1_ECOLX|nr:tRNA-i(6)A37 thiotransferase enzyme MiaB [Escherichia coli]